MQTTNQLIREFEKVLGPANPYANFTTAELELKVYRHQEGRVTQPAKMLAAIKAEIAARKARKLSS